MAQEQGIYHEIYTHMLNRPVEALSLEHLAAKLSQKLGLPYDATKYELRYMEYRGVLVSRAGHDGTTVYEVGSKMGEGTVVAADGMPLQVGDKVVDENGNAFKVVSFTKEKASGKSFVLCKKKGFLDETVCCSVFLPEEIVHAPSWWPWWRRGAE